MRASDPPISYLVGTPKGRLNQMSAALLGQEWQSVREGVEVKLVPQAGELYVLAQSRDRIHKERSIRQRQLKWLWQRLKKIARMRRLSRDRLLVKLGEAKHQAPAAWRLVKIQVPKAGLEKFVFSLRKDRLRVVRRREGRYLLRTNLTQYEPAQLWEFYTQLTQVEEAFRNLKGDLSIRPIYHKKEERIEAHIFVSFLAYCLHVTLRQRARGHAPGLTPRSILEKFKTMQMIDVHLPTTDGRTIILPRYTQPEDELKLLLEHLKFELPAQPPPRLAANRKLIHD
jgi:hypothetical protein